MDDLTAYNYELPAELIAQHPLPERDTARLLVVGRKTGRLEHRTIADLPDLLHPGDCLVFNDTRVVPARLFGTRESTGGKWEGLFLSVDDSGRWKLIGQTRGRLQPGERIGLSPSTTDSPRESVFLKLLACDEDGIWTAEPSPRGASPSPRVASRGISAALNVLQTHGTVPLPPYIERSESDPEDVNRYQTVFAEHPGAVAAPTAGLHFTSALLDRLQVRGIETAFVTLHVGIGTFRPISTERLSEHHMHAEWCRITPETAAQLNRVRSGGGRIIAVGTTAVRTLESAVDDGEIQPIEHETRLFIRPPYPFKAVDALLTNFHLPKSTLLVLVSAFLGREQTLAAYETAVRERYRFYSYGDAMLIV